MIALNFAVNSQVRNRREMFVDELVDAALDVASRHKIRGSSVELEIDLWNNLNAALAGLPGTDDGWDHRIALFVRAAYAAMLRHGIAGSFVDLELALWERVRRVVRRRRFVPVERDLRLSQVLAIR